MVNIPEADHLETSSSLLHVDMRLIRPPLLDSHLFIGGLTLQQELYISQLQKNVCGFVSLLSTKNIMTSFLGFMAGQPTPPKVPLPEIRVL